MSEDKEQAHHNAVPGIELSQIIRLIYAYVQIKDPHRRQMLLNIAEVEAKK